MLYYNIRGLVRIRSEVPLRELEKFREHVSGRADLVVSCKSGLNYLPRLSRKIHRGNPTLSYIEHLGSLGATVSISSRESMEVEVNWLLKYSNAVLYVNVVEPLLRLLIARKGLALVHSACLSRKDKAVLVSAPPDTGKTTAVLKCLHKGWFSFLSDDMTILGLDGSVSTFPKPFTISAHTYSSTVDRRSNKKGIRSKLTLRIKSYVHSKTGRTVLRLIGRLNVPILTLNALGQIMVKPPKIFVEDLVRGVITKPTAQAAAVCLLRKGPDRIETADPNEVLEELLANSEEAFGFPPYSDIFRNLDVMGMKASDLLREERRLLESLVRSVRCYRLYSDTRRWDELLTQVMDEIARPIPTPRLAEVEPITRNIGPLPTEPLLRQP